MRVMSVGPLKTIYYKLLPTGLQAYISKLKFKPKIGKGVRFSGKGCFFYGDVSIGDHVVIGGNCILANIHIGKYTVFAQNFRCLFNHHDYRAFAVNNNLSRLRPVGIAPEDADSLVEPNESYRPITHIGSDVWFGEFVTVQGGITIGDGAIIAARSVVTHDVPPYAIVAGVPARIIKYRFDPDTIAFLEKLKWWDWSEEKIRLNYWRLCRFDRTLLDEDTL